VQCKCARNIGVSASANEASKNVSRILAAVRSAFTQGANDANVCRWQCIDVPDDIPDSAVRGRRSREGCRKKRRPSRLGAEQGMKLRWRYGAKWMTRRRAVDSKTVRGTRKDVVVCDGRGLTMRENWMVHGSPGLQKPRPQGTEICVWWGVPSAASRRPDSRENRCGTIRGNTRGRNEARRAKGELRAVCVREWKGLLERGGRKTFSSHAAVASHPLGSSVSSEHTTAFGCAHDRTLRRSDSGTAGPGDISASSTPRLHELVNTCCSYHASALCRTPTNLIKLARFPMRPGAIADRREALVDASMLSA